MGTAPPCLPGGHRVGPHEGCQAANHVVDRSGLKVQLAVVTCQSDWLNHYWHLLVSPVQTVCRNCVMTGADKHRPCLHGTLLPVVQIMSRLSKGQIWVRRKSPDLFLKSQELLLKRWQPLKSQELFLKPLKMLRNSFSSLWIPFFESRSHNIIKSISGNVHKRSIYKFRN